MKLVEIHSTKLPEIDASVKECVNQGQWLLFRADANALGVQKAAYFLKANSAVFALDEVGTIVEQVAAGAALPEIREVVYFSDIPQAESLSNAPVSAYAYA